MQLGQKHYFTGKACWRGHIDKRYARDGCCMECARIKARKCYTTNTDTFLSRARNWRKENPNYHREQHRRWKGLPEPTRPCPELCECCGNPPRRPRKALCLDHDHKTGEFRGWLCNDCNLAIGRLGDNVTGLLRALAYLRYSINGSAPVVDEYGEHF